MELVTSNFQTSSSIYLHITPYSPVKSRFVNIIIPQEHYRIISILLLLCVYSQGSRIVSELGAVAEEAQRRSVVILVWIDTNRQYLVTSPPPPFPPPPVIIPLTTNTFYNKTGGLLQQAVMPHILHCVSKLFWGSGGFPNSTLSLSKEYNLYGWRVYIHFKTM